MRVQGSWVFGYGNAADGTIEPAAQQRGCLRGERLRVCLVCDVDHGCCLLRGACCCGAKNMRASPFLGRDRSVRTSPVSKQTQALR